METKFLRLETKLRKTVTFYLLSAFFDYKTWFSMDYECGREWASDASIDSADHSGLSSHSSVPNIDHPIILVGYDITIGLYKIHGVTFLKETLVTLWLRHRMEQIFIKETIELPFIQLQKYPSPYHSNKTDQIREENIREHKNPI